MVNVYYLLSEDEQSHVLTVTGHANYKSDDFDAVCASLSTLIYTLAQNVQDAYELGWLRKKPVLHLEDGDARITCKPKVNKRPAVGYLFHVIRRGIEMLIENYPDNVSLTLQVPEETPTK